MAYNATYTADDLSTVTVDGIVKIFVAVVSFATLVGLILLYGWFRKKMK
jgi:hypothetical protein